VLTGSRLWRQNGVHEAAPTAVTIGAVVAGGMTVVAAGGSGGLALWWSAALWCDTTRWPG
jgi:hypothetical protein